MYRCTAHGVWTGDRCPVCTALRQDVSTAIDRALVAPIVKDARALEPDAIYDRHGALLFGVETWRQYNSPVWDELHGVIPVIFT